MTYKNSIFTVLRITILIVLIVLVIKVFIFRIRNMNRYLCFFRFRPLEKKAKSKIVVIRGEFPE